MDKKIQREWLKIARTVATECWQDRRAKRGVCLLSGAMKVMEDHARYDQSESHLGTEA